MAKKLYASGRSRQRAERAKRTQARNVVTMNKSAKETARKTAARSPDAPKGTRIKTSQGVPKSSSGLAGKPKRSYPKDVTKRDSPSPKRKYPTRQDGERKNVASAKSKKVTKQVRASVSSGKSRFGTGTVKPGYEEIHPMLTRLGVTRKKK